MPYLNFPSQQCIFSMVPTFLFLCCNHFKQSKNYAKFIYYSLISDTKESSSSYIKQVQFLFMYMFQFKQRFTKTDVANYTTQAAENMFDLQKETFFWTKHQKALIYSRPKRVLFTSEFGTGKTTLLKAKAKQLSSEKQIFFVLFTELNGLLFQSLTVEFEDQDNVKVVSLQSE
jgi:hypothetical protein